MPRFAEDVRVTFQVVVPAAREPGVADSTCRLLDALRAQAQGYAGSYVHVIIVNVAERRVWCAETCQPIDGCLATHLSRCSPAWRSSTIRARIKSHVFGSSGPGAARVCVLMNPGFLLADPPPIVALIEGAEREPTWCAAQSTRDVYAFAFRPRALGSEDLWPALRLLTASMGDQMEDDWGRLVRRAPLAPAASFVENSPALAGVTDARSRRPFDSPLFVNTALREMMGNPQDRGQIGIDPGRMATALLAQRVASQVPWVFNT